MHASLGPSAAMARYEAGRLHVWTHSQGIFPLRQALADTLGMPPEGIEVEHIPGPGCYGHNGADDVALDAALVARATPGQTVLVKWTREEEHAFEPYSSCMLMDLEATVTDDGHVVAWSHDTYSDTHVNRPRPGPNGLGPSCLLYTSPSPRD